MGSSVELLLQELGRLGCARAFSGRLSREIRGCNLSVAVQVAWSRRLHSSHIGLPAVGPGSTSQHALSLPEPTISFI